MDMQNPLVSSLFGVFCNRLLSTAPIAANAVASKVTT
jgi:hypothetical protein